MRFKPLIILFLAVIASSCSWIRTEPKSVGSFQSKSLDLSCIKKVPDGLRDLFGGAYSTSPEDQKSILETFGCLDHALEIFSDFTRGANPDSYSSRELQAFGNRYLPKETPITDPFIQSIFELKRAIVGGNEFAITKIEISSLRAKLSKFGEIIAPFAGHITVLIKPESAAPGARKAASLALNRFVSELSTILSHSPNSLDWTDLALFVRELELFTDTGEVSALTLVREQLPVFQYVKLLLVGGSEASIESTKWKPIFNSISHFYSALLLTSNTSDLLEQMSLESQSSEEEQSRAVIKLTGLLRALIQDETLHSRPTLQLIADRFAKALLLNALVFPRSRGSLALTPFLETASLRKLSGTIVDQIMKLDRTSLTIDALQSIADNVISLFEQAAISNSPSPGAIDPLNLQSVLEYLSELTPLLGSTRESQVIKSALLTSKSMIPLLIGRETDRLTPKDLRQLITKALDLYSVWAPENQQTISEKLGSSLDILTRNPSPIALNSSQMMKAIDELAAFFPMVAPGTRIDWEEVRNHVTRGMKLKSVLYQSPEGTLTRYELTHLSFLYEPFRRSENLGESLIALSNLLQIRNFQNTQLNDLIDAIDPLLPESRRTRALGLNPLMLSHLKVLVVGGSPQLITRQEFPELARMAGLLYSELKPRLDGKFSLALDSRTADLVASALRAFIDGRKGFILMTDLKAVLMDLFQKWNLSPQDAVIDRFLIGLHTRVLKKMKSRKPESLNGLAFQAWDLGVFLDLANRIHEELKPLESLYRSMDSANGGLPGKVLLEHLSGPDTQRLVRSIIPLLGGSNHRLRFRGRDEVLDRYTEFEMAYKLTVYKALNTLFVMYKVSEDPIGPGTPRLNEVDLTDLLVDVNDLITDLKLSYGYSPAEKSAKARLRSINLFTRNGNGDSYIDPIETTEFLTITFGGKKILSPVESELFSTCFPGRSNTDEISVIPVQCLMKVFFQKAQFRKFYEETAPLFTSEINSWNENGMDDFRKSMLDSIDPRWTDTGVLERVDLEAFVSVPFYTENLFQRFDLNSSSILEFSEAMKGFPVFCEEIRKTGGSSLRGSCKPGENPDQIEAVYGYLLYRGVPPRGIRSTDSLWQRLRSAKDILSWFNFWKKLDKTPEVRDAYPPKIDRKGILKIMSNLSTAT